MDSSQSSSARLQVHRRVRPARRSRPGGARSRPCAGADAAGRREAVHGAVAVVVDVVADLRGGSAGYAGVAARGARAGARAGADTAGSSRTRPPCRRSCCRRCRRSPRTARPARRSCCPPCRSPELRAGAHTAARREPVDRAVAVVVDAVADFGGRRTRRAGIAARGAGPRACAGADAAARREGVDRRVAVVVDVVAELRGSGMDGDVLIVAVRLGTRRARRVAGRSVAVVVRVRAS